LPGGLTIAAMCPLVDKMNLLSPPITSSTMVDSRRPTLRGLPARLAMNSTPGRPGSQHRNGPAPTSTSNWSRGAAALACAVAIADLQGETPMPAWW
jgi:hypothetical protein